MRRAPVRRQLWPADSFFWNDIIHRKLLGPLQCGVGQRGLALRLTEDGSSFAEVRTFQDCQDLATIDRITLIDSNRYDAARQYRQNLRNPCLIRNNRSRQPERFALTLYLHDCNADSRVMYFVCG